MKNENVAKYILWDDRIHTDPPVCTQISPSTITILKSIVGFDFNNKFCPKCFEGKSILKCKNCFKSFFSILPDKITFFGKNYNLSELDKIIRNKTFLSEEKLLPEGASLTFKIECPACRQVHPYAIKDIKII